MPLIYRIYEEGNDPDGLSALIGVDYIRRDYVKAEGRTCVVKDGNEPAFKLPHRRTWRLNKEQLNAV